MSLKFCGKCHNMLTMSVTDEDLIYRCPMCGLSEKVSGNNPICVLSRDEHFQGGGAGGYDHLVNEYTKYDPTCPRTREVMCPNDNCPTRYSGSDSESSSSSSRRKPLRPQEAVIVRVDEVNLIYMYICVECNTRWINRSS